MNDYTKHADEIGQLVVNYANENKIKTDQLLGMLSTVVNIIAVMSIIRIIKDEDNPETPLGDKDE